MCLTWVYSQGDVTLWDAAGLALASPRSTDYLLKAQGVHMAGSTAGVRGLAFSADGTAASKKTIPATHPSHSPPALALLCACVLSKGVKCSL